MYYKIETSKGLVKELSWLSLYPFLSNFIPTALT